MSNRNYRLATASAIAGGIAWAIAGPLQLAGLNEHETKVVTFGEHLLISLFSIALVLTAPGVLALARHANNDIGAKIAATGMTLLGLVALSSNINGADLGFFIVAAPLTNLAWLGGSIALAVSLHRAGRVPTWVAVGLPLAQVFALPLSTVGGGMIAGAYWVAVAWLMRTGHIEAKQQRVVANPVHATR